MNTKLLAEALSTDAFVEVFNGYLKQAEEGFEALASMPAAEATFDTLVVPYHALDLHLKTVWFFLNGYHKTDGNDRTGELVTRFQPLIVRLSDTVLLDERFFRLLELVWKAEEGTLAPGARRSLELLMRDRTVAGVHLSPEKKTRLKEINERLMELCEIFGRFTVESRKVFFYQIDDEAVLGQMPAQDKDAAKHEAQSRGLDGWVFTLSPPSALAVMRYVVDRDMRKTFSKEASLIGVREPHDNRPIVLELLQLRREKGQLLGFADFSGFVLQTRMAGTADAVNGMLNNLRGPFKAKAEKEIAEITAFSGLDQLEIWDLSFYSNTFAKKQFSLDEAALQEYFELEETLRGLFSIAGTLFGIRMQQVDVPVYNADVRTFEVFRGDTLIGYFLLDPFARPTKRAGAWCEYVRCGRQESSGRVPPIVANVCNFPKATGDKPTLLSHMDVRTLFHEFGHALHVLLSEHAYPNVEAFAVEWDFVELPSQLMENWCWDHSSLALFAKHYKTNELLPAAMLDALKRKQTFRTGSDGLHQLQYAAFDVDIHSLPAAPATVQEIDAYALQHARAWDVLPVPDFFRSYTSFGHVFEGEYAVGYYSYSWAEMLEADVFERFQKEGVLDPALGEAYRAHILSQGAIKPGRELFHAFMGRDVDPTALLRKKGMA